jgi:Terpene synthase family 2, C-terminal metal binding
MRSGQGSLETESQLRKLADDPIFREKFLPRTTPDESAAINRLLRPVVEGAEAWCADHPLLAPGPIVPVALLMCVQFPGLDLQGTLLRVKAVLWVFAIDDFLDGDQTAPSAAADISLECRTVGASPVGKERAQSEYGNILLDVKGELARYPAFGPLGSTWSNALSRMIDGMMFEYWMRQRNNNSDSVGLPALDEYLYYARNSIGLPFVWFTSLIVAESSASSVDKLLELSRLAEECGVAMRLANDIRSFRAENRIGKINAVNLLARSATGNHEGTDEAESQVSHLIADSCRLARHLAGQQSTSVKHFAERFVRATEWGVDLYQRSDFRAFGTA